MRFLKEKDIFYHSHKINEVEDKTYITLCYYNEEGEKEFVNFNGHAEDLENLKPGTPVKLHFKVYKDSDNYYKIIGLSVYKVEVR